MIRSSAIMAGSAQGSRLPRPIRVAWMSSVSEKGGAEVYPINFLRHLPPDRYRPGVILLRPGPLEAGLAGRFGLPVNARWMLQGARRQRYKGQRHLLQALASLGSEFRDLHAIVTGGALFGLEEDYLQAQRRLAHELGIADRVHLTGFIAEPRTLGGLILQGALMVHPALDGDFGPIVAEAHAFGRPLLAFAAVGPVRSSCRTRPAGRRPSAIRTRSTAGSPGCSLTAPGRRPSGRREGSAWPDISRHLGPPKD